MIRRLTLSLALALSPLALAQDAAPENELNIVIPQRGIVPLPHPHRPPPIRDAAPRLTAVGVKVDIHEQTASTSLRMTIRNDGGRVQESQLLVPVPDGAVYRHFELEGLGEQGIARILPKEEARRIYDDIVRRTLDPGLLEFVGYNLIRSSVFPVPPRGEQSVRIVYDQVLAADGDRIDYVLPRSDSLEKTGVEWSYALDIRSARPIASVYSPSHDITTERIAPGHVLVKVTAGSAARDPGALRISYLLEKSGDGLAASLLAYPDPEVGGGEGGYFMLLAALPAEADRPKIMREVTIVLDRSGSMRGQKWEQAVEAARQVVEGLSEGETFNIIDFSDSVASMADKPVAKTRDTTAQARKYLDALTPQGGTNIHDALVEALRQEPTPGALPMVLFLTDGLPTIGERREAAIREAAKRANTHKRRIFTFGVGYDVNSPLLGGLATATRATSTFVLPDEDVEVKVGQVFRRLSGPVLASPVLTVLDEEGGARRVREVMPAELPDFFEGDQVLILGQYAADKPLRLRISGDSAGRPRTFEMSFNVDKATTRNSFVPRLWASRKIAAMVEEIRQAGADGSLAREDGRMKELVDEIVRLSTKWGILTEYTAFLATETTVAGVPVAPAGAPAREREFSDLAYRATMERAEARGGAAAVNQEANINLWKSAQKVDARNVYCDENMKIVETAAIRQVADCTLYKRGTRWVDARVLKDEEAAPDQTVEFGTPEFAAILDRLAAANQQGVLALGGEVYLKVGERNILVRGPGAK